MQNDPNSQLIDAAKARLLLCIGGVFGLHRLYCGQSFESLIYMSTFGVFLLGPLLDVFLLSGIVKTFNDRQIKATLKTDDDNDKSQTKRVRFSFGRFICELLYGVWLGLLGVILSSFLFKNTSDRIGLTLISAFAVSSGVWLVGCCGNRKCDFLYSWIAALVTSTFTIYWSDSSTIRSLIIIAAASALNTNRSARLKHSNEFFVPTRKYMFYLSLFMTSFCILFIGLSKTVWNREIAFLLKNSDIRIRTFKVGPFLTDYMLERKNLTQHYPLMDHSIEYVPMLKLGSNISNVPWKSRKQPRNDINPPYSQLFNLIQLHNFNYELEFFDDQTRIAEFHWLRYGTAFLVDYVRISIIVTEYPLKMALWRMYLIWTFDMDPFVTDKEVHQKCKPYRQSAKVSTTNKNTDYVLTSKRRACELLSKNVVF